MSVVWHSCTLVILPLIMEFLNLLKHCYGPTRASFHKVEIYVATAISMSLSGCALPAKMSAFNSLMQQNACHSNIKWTFADLLPWYFYAIKTNNRTIRSRLSQPTSAGKGGDTNELQAHHCITLQLWTWLLCGVSFIPAKNCHCKNQIN